MIEIIRQIELLEKINSLGYYKYLLLILPIMASIYIIYNILLYIEIKKALYKSEKNFLKKGSQIKRRIRRKIKKTKTDTRLINRGLFIFTIVYSLLYFVYKSVSLRDYLITIIIVLITYIYFAYRGKFSSNDKDVPLMKEDILFIHAFIDIMISNPINVSLESYLKRLYKTTHTHHLKRLIENMLIKAQRHYTEEAFEILLEYYDYHPVVKRMVESWKLMKENEEQTALKSELKRSNERLIAKYKKEADTDKIKTDVIIVIVFALAGLGIIMPNLIKALEGLTKIRI